MPDKLHELQRLWLIEATKYDVLPLDDRTVERIEPRQNWPAGTIIAQGGSFGGWGLMMHDGATRFAYNLLGVNVFLTDAKRPVPARGAPGPRRVRLSRRRPGQGRHGHPVLRR